MQPKSTKRTKIAPHLYERGDRYLVILRKDGKQLVRALKARNRTDAKREAPSVIADLLSGGSVVVGDRNVTIGALVDAFIAREEGPNRKLAANTLAQRKIALRKHVLPILKERTKASEITSAHVRHLIDKLGAKGLSGSSVRVSVSSLSAVLDFGVRGGQLARNPVRDLTRGDLPSGKRTTEPRYLTSDQVLSLLDQLGDEFRPIAASCFYGGLRVSEALSLKWSDVNFDSGTITVRQGKTEASAATIPLLDPLAVELKAHRQRQAAQGVHRISGDALVFQTYTGRPQSRRNALRAVNAASVKAGLSKPVKAHKALAGEEPVGLHDLRHSLAANAFSLGLSPVEVSRLLRHANPQVTMTVYAGLAGNQVDVLSSKLSALGGAA